jgi:sulfate permease, SulP family
MRLLEAVLGALRPERSVPSLTSGIVVGVVFSITTVSYTALVFSGELAPYLGIGLGIALTSAALLAASLSLSASYPGTIAAHSAPPTVVLSLLTASVATQLHGAPAEVMLPAVLGAIGVASLATGLLFYGLGAFRLGVVIRFIPYPVIGGVAAGVGWLLMSGGFYVATGLRLQWATLQQTAQPGVLAKWLVALAFALLVLFLQRRIKHYLLVPGLIGGAVAAFFGATALLGIPLARLRAENWLLSTLGASHPGFTPDITLLTRVDWGLLARHTPDLGTLMVVSAITLLMNSSALELVVHRDINLDRDLRATGLVNMALGAVGGIAGMVNMSHSSLAYRMGAAGRLTGLASAATCVAVLFFGTSVLSLLPRPVVAGMLFVNGLSLLREWLYYAWFKLPRSDYLIVVMILMVMAVIGYVQGIAVGLVAGVVLFVVNYSRISAIKHSISGGHIHSNVDRPEPAREFLTQHGNQIMVLKLQGYLFFGTCDRVLARVRSRLEDKAAPPLRCVVLDFRLVNGLDSSSVLSFLKMQQVAEAGGLRIVFTHLSDALSRLLIRGGVGGAAHPHVLEFADLHRGLQWGEEYLLGQAQLDASGDVPVPIQVLLERILPEPTHVALFLGYLERQEIEPGANLITQGTQSKDLFFIEAGRFRVELELRDGQRTLVRTLGAGTTVGEVAFYLDMPRSAWVVADKPAIMYQLTSERLGAMSHAHPHLASALHEFMARMLAGRLADTNRLLQEVID